MNIISLSNRFSEKPVRNLSLLFCLVYFSIIFLMLFYLKTPPSYFLHDDGYYQMGKDFYNGTNGLSNMLVAPLFPFILSLLNVFPEIIHPYLRIFITAFFVILNILIAFKIFENILTKKQFTAGMLLLLLNPLLYHWTLKLTPEIYVAFFLGIIILSIKYFIITRKTKYFLSLLIFITAATFFKPVFVLIPFVFLLWYLLIRNYKPAILFLFVFIYSVIIQISVMKYSEPLDRNGLNYTNVNMLGGYFFTEAILHTGRIDFGSGEDFIKAHPEKSNLKYLNDNMYNWIDNYRTHNPARGDIAMVVNYLIENPATAFLSRAISPFLFISVASALPETIMNFIINGFIVLISILSIIHIKKFNENHFIILSLLGYYAIFFITFSFARYSLPFLFILAPYSGILISKWLNIEKSDNILSLNQHN